MSAYTPPIEDYQFVLFDLFDAQAIWAQCSDYKAFDAETVMTVLGAAGAFAGDVLAPTNADGDTCGATFATGAVTVPASFRTAYSAFQSGGWPALACDPHWGGQGLPQSINAAIYEMLMSANHAWSMYPGLAHGAYECISAYGSDAIKQAYLPKLVSGEWLATMALTEPHCGTDLGMLRTNAVAGLGGEYAITGNKIFISGGDHDLTDNILHLVLARAPDAPPGTKGISLFLVPKVRGDGAPNGVHVQGIEHKMGINGSATCQLRFEAALGWMIGEPHQGLRAMFVMMNAARLHVGLQGLGHMERTYQLSLAYAQERAQGGKKIIEHPVVQKLLLTQRAWLEGSRMLAMWTALSIDRAEKSADAEVRARSSKRAALLTPIVKAVLTDRGFENASAALQVFGGYGYTRDMRVEQHLRDARIAMIYEGTNEIQAIDLLQRKVLADGGETLVNVLVAIGATTMMPNEVDTLNALVTEIQGRSITDPDAIQRVATEFLNAVGLVLLAALWKYAAQKASNTNRATEKAATAAYFLDMIFPTFASHCTIIRNGLAPKSVWASALPTTVA